MLKTKWSHFQLTRVRRSKTPLVKLPNDDDDEDEDEDDNTSLNKLVLLEFLFCLSR